MKEEVILREATFSPRVKTYIFFVVLVFLFSTVIGIIFVPFWILGLGQWMSGKYYKTLSCQITNKNLKFSKGLVLNIQKTIPVENIQDLSFVGGPVLRYFGLTLIKIETAGGGGGQGHQNMMSMLGINDAESFKSAILLQREQVIHDKYSNSNQSVSSTSDTQLLMDIKNELIEIKNKMKDKL
jgi:putative membrane protein